MSALTDALAASSAKQCSAAKARDRLDPESAADFDAWMASEPTSNGYKLTDTGMWAALQRLEHRVALQTLGRHRRQQGECGCRP